jgi:glycosyltransferase involved in cell wall biosynthesis
VAFVYTDYQVFGRTRYVEKLGDYNLFRLLTENTIGYACMMRKSLLEAVGGYDESLVGYEDWELGLRFGERGHRGHHIGRTLFRYRKHGRSLHDVARARHDELVARIRAKHPDLYEPAAYREIKRTWEAAACVVAPEPPPGQTISDYQIAPPGRCRSVLAQSSARAFAIAGRRALDPLAAELAALAVWAGQECVELPDGTLAASREALAECENTDQLRPRAKTHRMRMDSGYAQRAGLLNTLVRHLSNAELLSADSWVQRPVESLTRVIPLRIKETVNRISGRPLFDLSFYLQFQPRAVLLNGSPIAPVEYLPPVPARKRIALITPHLGVGGAESVLLEIASACDRSRYEISVIAMQSRDDRWTERWRALADHVYDLAPVIPPERVPAALYCIAANWRFDYLVIQNSLPAYAMAAELKNALPGARLINLIHAAGEEGWDLIAAITAALPYFDVHVAISGAVRDRLIECGVAADQVRLIRNGVDLDRFQPGPSRTGGPFRILFAARLDPVKRPLLLPDIAAALKRRRPACDFVFVIAGEGPEGERLRARVQELGVMDLFEFPGHVEDIAPLFAASDLLILTSAHEGVPLVVLEAMASACPVVASDAGAVHEVVDEQTGFLIRRNTGEVEQFAETIDYVLNKPDLRGDLSARARRQVETCYDRRRALEEYGALFA